MVDGPHAAPDFFTDAGIAAFYATEWQVHHHSSRTGVRLVGPTPEWARADGGEAGLHPSNIHDTPYTVGRGRLHRRHADPARARRPEPRRLRVPGDGRSATSGGSSVSSRPATRALRPVDRDEARALRRRRVQRSHVGASRRPRRPCSRSAPRDGDAPQVTYRAQRRRAPCSSSTGRWRSTSTCGCARTRSATWVADAERRRRRRGHARDPLAAGAGRPGRAHGRRDARRCCARAEDELPALDDVVVASRIVHLPLSWDDPADARGDRALHARRARRRALVPVEHRVHPPHQRPRRRRRRAPHRVRRRVPRARPRRRVPRRAGRGAGRSAPPAGHHEVQPGAHVDAGERGRHRRRVPVHLRHGGAGRLPVRRPHGAGVEPLRRGPALRPGRRPGCCASSTGSAGTRSRPTSCSSCAPRRAPGRLELDIDDGVFTRADYRAVARARRRRHRRVPRPPPKPRSPPSAPRWEEAGELARVDGLELAPGDLAREDALGGPLPDGAVVVEAPLHACVWRLDVAEGDVVAPGTALVVARGDEDRVDGAGPVGGTVSRVLCRRRRRSWRRARRSSWWWPMTDRAGRARRRGRAPPRTRSRVGDRVPSSTCGRTSSPDDDLRERAARVDARAATASTSRCGACRSR